MSYRILWAALALLASGVERSAAATPDFSAMNQTFGVPLFADDRLWDDVDGAVAMRLKWPPESKTSRDASFRRYAGANERVLGARPFSMVLYSKAGAPDEISMVFANKGDSAEVRNGRVNPDYKKQIAADAKIIEESLAAILGKPKVVQIGQGAKTRETASRWDWNGHAIFLSAPRGEYVAVRILPVERADGEAAARVTDADLRTQLAKRVEHRPNGDVILRDIPMVNQGPKGYCVPATWERALRYLGIPADMYVLAMAGQTEAGGGTSVEGMMGGAGEIVRRNGRRMTTTGGRLTTQAVAGYIDKGLPVMWCLFVDKDQEENVTNRSMQRRGVTDWDAYKEMLKPWRRAAKRTKIDHEAAHMRMIIGYNPNTNEIAISDSWGPQFAERWVTVEEANAVSDGRFTVVNW